eukprot:scaffold3858_cov153-Skeletonema_menzelii.AAC.4
MKFNTATTVVLLLSTATTKSKSQAQVTFEDEIFSALGPAHQLRMLLDSANSEDGTMNRAAGRIGGKSGKGNKVCDPNDVVLADYAQWVAEKGYWIGEYSFYGSDGQPNVSPSWPYPYNASTETCGSANPNVIGNGTCGTNGNSLVFFADQEATTCSDNPELAGDVNGPFQSAYGTLNTTTELVGAENSLLYQIFVPGFENPLQSQLTTLTKSQGSEEFDIRTRTAQGFNVATGEQTSASFYRERKVSKVDFYTELSNTIEEYNILDSDLCFLNGGSGRIPVDGYTPGYDQCVEHLQSSFDL